MKIAITGATGMIGQALARSLRAEGYTVLSISRKPGQDHVIWDLDKGTIEVEKLQGCDAFINLAGSSIAQRWSNSVKEEIVDSRIKATTLISKTALGLDPKPKVILSASAIGYYGPHPGKPVDEESPPGDGFLADVCQQWEAATDSTEKGGIRVVHIRIGVVLSPDGGALAKMLTPFKAGLGGPVGNGKQMVSWVSLDDLVNVFQYCLTNDSISGAVNATAPNPVSNAEFATTLGEVLGKPAKIPAPAFALKLAMGEMVEETVLADQTVLPKRLQASGFSFEHPTLKPALEAVLKA